MSQKKGIVAFIAGASAGTWEDVRLVITFIKEHVIFLHGRIQRGGGGGGGGGGGDTGGLNPPEKSQNIGFLSNTGPDPLKNYKSKLEFNVGPSSARQRNAI